MTEDEIIIVNKIPQLEYDKIVTGAIEYAILSIPFTIDRMNLKSITGRIKNIAKGKIAEGLFLTFCKRNGIDVDSSRCTTPFYTIDRRDFILDDYEWDIKNNFINYNNEDFTGNYTNLPALIPDRFSGDQWSKRNKIQHKGLKGVRFLFSFMKRDEIFKIVLSDKQNKLIRKVYQKYNGSPQQSKPFNEEAFWEEMKNRGMGKNFELQIINRPYLIITGYAGNEELTRFKKEQPKTFLDGVFRTRIINRVTEIKALPSFASMFSYLKDKIHYAEFKISLHN